jgi:hypothetical protein
MPCNYKEYPENWKWLSTQIIKDAGNRCELCYAPNAETVARYKDHKHPWEKISDIKFKDDLIDKFRPVKIVLTVHHIDSNKMNSKKQNIIALCQRCHLRLDLQKHMANRKAKNNNDPRIL